MKFKSPEKCFICDKPCSYSGCDIHPPTRQFNIGDWVSIHTPKGEYIQFPEKGMVVADAGFNKRGHRLYRLDKLEPVGSRDVPSTYSVIFLDFLSGSPNKAIHRWLST